MTNLAYNDSGAGDPVLFIAGTGGAGRTWHIHQVPAFLAAGYRCLTFDYRGIAATENADALLNRDMSAVSDTNARSPLNALRHIRNKWSLSGTTLTVTKEDDSTTAWTATMTTNASADPITGSDPA